MYCIITLTLLLCDTSNISYYTLLWSFLTIKNFFCGMCIHMHLLLSLVKVQLYHLLLISILPQALLNHSSTFSVVTKISVSYFMSTGVKLCCFRYSACQKHTSFCYVFGFLFFDTELWLLKYKKYSWGFELPFFFPLFNV